MVTTPMKTVSGNQPIKDDIANKAIANNTGQSK